MHVEIGFCKGRKIVFLYNLPRNNAIDIHLGKRFLNRVANDLLRKLAFERIHRQNAFEPIIFIKRLERGIDHRNLPELVLYATVEKVFARFQLLRDVGLVKPNRRKVKSPL